jgi:hypothetical protein
MLAELILQFSALCFCSSKREEKKPKKKKKGKKWFSASRLADVSPQFLSFRGCYIRQKAKLSVGHCTLCSPYLCIGNIFIGKKKKPGYLILATKNLSILLETWSSGFQSQLAIHHLGPPFVVCILNEGHSNKNEMEY